MAGWPARLGDGRIAMLTVRGLVTGPVFARIGLSVAQIERSDGSMAGVSVFEHAVIALTAEEMFAAELDLVRHGQLALPRAFLVSPTSLQVFQRYAWLMANEGVGRAAFTGAQMAQARQWAQAMGRVMRQERDRTAQAKCQPCTSDAGARMP
jgi:hypothetical protein